MHRTHTGPIAAALFTASLLAAAPTFAQQAPVRPEGHKDPGTAQVIGLLAPGAGQLWVGGSRQKKGFLLLGVGLGAPIAGAAISSSGGSCSHYTQNVCSSHDFTPFYLGLAAALGAGIYGILTADDDARDHNRSLSARTGLLERVQPIVAPRRDQAGVGLAVRF